MSIVLNVSIRMYLPDVVGSTDDVVEKLKYWKMLPVAGPLMRYSALCNK